MNVYGAPEALAPDLLSTPPGLGGDQCIPAAKTDAPPLVPGLSAQDALQRLLHYYVGAIGQNTRSVLLTTDPEGPHQARVGLRRLRTTLRMFKPAMPPRVHRALHWLARDFGAVLSELRDADVMIEDVIRPRTPEHAELSSILVPALARWRERIRAHVRAPLGALQRELERLAQHATQFEGAPSRALALAHVETEAAWGRASARGNRLDKLSPHALHEFRKTIKGLRYAAEIRFALAETGCTPSALPALKRLQNVLGRLNDLATLADFNPPLGDKREEKALRALKVATLAREAAPVQDALAEAIARWRWLAACGSGLGGGPVFRE